MDIHLHSMQVQTRGLFPYVKGLGCDYYRLCGWDGLQGKPWRRTLERVGLSE